jgi:hypothetical protein
VGLPGERRSSILKEGFLPLIEQGRVDLVLLAHLGDGDLVQQVLREDFDLFFGTAMFACRLILVAHALFLVEEK